MSESQDLSAYGFNYQDWALSEWPNFLPYGGESLDELSMDRHSIDLPSLEIVLDSTTSEPCLLEPLYEGISDTTRTDSGYAGSEATDSNPSRRRDRPSKQQENPPKGVEEPFWCCQVCGRAYTRSDNLRNHQREKHNIRFPDDKAKHSQKERSSSLAKRQDVRMAKSMQSDPRKVSLREASPWKISKDDSGGTPVTVSLVHRLESCLPASSSQSTKGFRIPLVIKIDGVATNVNIDVYEKSLNTTQLWSLDDFKTSELEPQLPPPPPPPSPPLPRSKLKVRRRRASLAMEQQPITTIEAPEIMSDPRTPLIPSPFEHLAHSSSKDEGKLMGHRTSDIVHEMIELEPSESKAEVSKIETESSEERENVDDDASHCSGVSVDSSEEGDDSDGGCDNITTWDYSRRDALPSFLPYIRGHDADTSSPCGDSPDSGSTTSGTTSDTSASSASGHTEGNSLRGNRYTSPNAGTGASNSNNPILGTKDGQGASFASDPQPLPLICWYPAAGIDCAAKHVKMSTEVRHLWNDHAWGKTREGPNHRLSDACQRCKRLFLSQQLLEEHVRGVIPCQTLSSVELEEFNREPNTLGISLECKKAIDHLRNRVDKEMKVNKVPVLYDGETMALLRQRVESNLLLYINGSQTSEKTARSQLWKWYFIFKHLRPDDEIPRNPFISAQQPAGLGEKSRADALLMFMRNLAQEECFSALDDDQRSALDRVFLNTVEMLGLNQANNRRRSAQNASRNARKRQKISPPESCECAPDSTNLTPAPTTPALAPAPIPVEVPPSVRDPVNFQLPAFTLPEVQNQLLPQTPSSVPRSFMPSADNLWLLRQQQQQQQQQQQKLEQQQQLQQQETEDAHSLFSPGDFGYIDSPTDYEGLLGFGTRDC